MSFDDDDVVNCYRHRPAYSDETVEILTTLANGGRVLDIGAGIGELTRRLAPKVRSIDAIDRSERMIERAKELSQDSGVEGKIRWLVGKFEDLAPALTGPYDLIYGGESLHWLDWEVSFAFFKNILKPGAYLCAIGRSLVLDSALDESVQSVVKRFSVNQNYVNYSLKDIWVNEYGFRSPEVRTTAPMPHTKSIEEWVNAYHSTSSLTRSRLGAVLAGEFDREMHKVLAPFASGGVNVTLHAQNTMLWGRF